jgi:hypothetical protein
MREWHAYNNIMLMTRLKYDSVGSIEMANCWPLLMLVQLYSATSDFSQIGFHVPLTLEFLQQVQAKDNSINVGTHHDRKRHLSSIRFKTKVQLDLTDNANQSFVGRMHR